MRSKTALFFFAFLPQFIVQTKDTVALQMLLLGVVLLLMATVTDTLYALLAGTAGRWLHGSLRYLRFQRYLSGTVYIGLGITAALAGRSQK